MNRQTFDPRAKNERQLTEDPCVCVCGIFCCGHAADSRIDPDFGRQSVGKTGREQVRIDRDDVTNPTVEHLPCSSAGSRHTPERGWISGGNEILKNAQLIAAEWWSGWRSFFGVGKKPAADMREKQIETTIGSRPVHPAGGSSCGRPRQDAYQAVILIKQTGSAAARFGRSLVPFDLDGFDLLPIEINTLIPDRPSTTHLLEVAPGMMDPNHFSRMGDGRTESDCCLDSVRWIVPESQQGGIRPGVGRQYIGAATPLNDSCRRGTSTLVPLEEPIGVQRAGHGRRADAMPCRQEIPIGRPTRTIPGVHQGSGAQAGAAVGFGEDHFCSRVSPVLMIRVTGHVDLTRSGVSDGGQTLRFSPPR